MIAFQDDLPSGHGATKFSHNAWSGRRDGQEEFLDLFCGGGGSGNGILTAFEEWINQGETKANDFRGTFVNHWDQAINIHSINHPHHRHYCTGVDDVTPEGLYPDEMGLRLLWASPECTHHSVARGGKPMNEQSRATAWCVVRWIRHKRPDHVLVENVREFADWGPLKQKRDPKTGRAIWIFKDENGKSQETTIVPFAPDFGEHAYTYRARLSAAGYEMSLTADKKRKAWTFKKWKKEIRRMGYELDHRVLCSADYGDPTSRRRLFVQAVRIDSGKRVVWPNPTHAKPDKKGKVPRGLKAWRTAREIINWDDLGDSIFTRKKPLAKKTLNRIAIGLLKYGLKDFILPHPRTRGGEARSVDEPLGTVTATRCDMTVASPKAEPFIVPHHSWVDAKGVDEPVSTITTTMRGEGLAQPSLTPFVVPQQSNPIPTSINDPVPTLVTEGSGPKLVTPAVVRLQGNGSEQNVDTPLSTAVGKAKHGLITGDAFHVPREGIRGNNQPASLDEPLKTVIASHGAGHIAVPCLIKLKGTGAANSVDQPVDTVAAGGLHHAIMQAFLMATDQHGGNGSYTSSIDEPAKTAVTKNNQAVATVEGVKLGSCIVEASHASRKPSDDDHRVNSLDAPLKTQGCSNRFGVMMPEASQLPSSLIQVSHGNEKPGDDNRRAKDLNDPLPTQSGSNDFGVMTPFLIGTAHEGADDSRVRSILEPLATVCGKRGDYALVRPWIYTYYSSGSVGQNVDDPLPTITAKERMGICYPVIEHNGEFYIIDIRFRMLQPIELARAQGFPDDFKWVGNKEQVVKAIGNSVSCGVARALALATLTQNADVRPKKRRKKSRLRPVPVLAEAA